MKGEGVPGYERRDEMYVKESERGRGREGKRDGREGGVFRGWVSLDGAVALL